MMKSLVMKGCDIGRGKRELNHVEKLSQSFSNSDSKS